MNTQSGRTVFRLSEHERELLEVMNGDREAGPWGAWVTACLESLRGVGYVTPGPNYTISNLGRQALADLRKVERTADH